MSGKPNKLNDFVKLAIIGVLVIGSAYFLSTFYKKTNGEKLTECNQNAAKIHDTERQTITENKNGYTPSEQQSYYKTSDNSYLQSLNNCSRVYK